MLLKSIIDKMDLEINYELSDEKEFETLALVGEKLSKRICTFIDDERYLDSISSSVVMIITTKKIRNMLCANKHIGFCVVENPRLLYFKIHNFLSCDERYVRKDYNTEIDASAQINPLSSIASKNVTIGKNVIIEEFVVIREGTIIGANSIIHAGSIIGGGGFELKREQDRILSVKHLGGVIIGENVEIKHNVVIDKALYPWDNTIIDDYSKIDSLVEIAHGVKIGKSTMVIATAAIFGRTVVGDECRIGPGAIIRNAIKIGDKSNVNLGSVVTKDVEKQGTVTGNFAVNHATFIKKFKNYYDL